MPELPEVETFRRVLEKDLSSRKINKINIIYSKTIQSDLIEFIDKVTNSRFINISRKGKFLLFHLDNSFCLLSHLRMEGKYFIEPIDEPRKKHDLVEFILDNNTKLVYNDVRKFGFISSYKEEEVLVTPPLSNLGKEPFEISEVELFEGLSKRKDVIKEALLDQNLISGLGNIYDDEVLYASRIHPTTPSNKISVEQCKEIIKNSISVLNKAINNKGSTIKSFHFKENESGSMQDYLLCYGKEGKKCPRCGSIFHKIRVGGRGTTYCPTCQQNKYKPYVIGITGPIHAGKSSVSAYFKSKGFVVFDADKQIKEMYQEKPIIETMVKMFGSSILKDDNIGKSELSSLLLIESNKKKLMDYLYPILFKRAEEFIDNAKGNVILDVPLLYKSNLDNLTDYVIYIDAPVEIREERILKENRDASTLLKINASYPASISKKKASIYINNDASIADLYNKLDKINIPSGYKY